MTRKAIITLPNKNLRRPSARIGYVDDSVKKIINSMKTATLDWEDNRAHEVGVALAAVQINDHRRIVIIRKDFNDKKNRQFSVFLNPVITKREGEIVEDYEGCLSIKNIYGKVPRYSNVRIKALDESGQEIRLKAEGFLARVLQHEIDHTKGILFIDHIKDRKDAFYNLTSEGNLESLDYEKSIADNHILWQ
jgi:peptide deformylase